MGVLPKFIRFFALMLFLMRFKDVNTNILPMSAIIKKKKKNTIVACEEKQTL